MLADRLVVEYATAGQAYELSLPIVPVDPTPIGGDNDYRYRPGVYKTPVDAGVIATFAALGRVWAPYYDASWVLSLKAVWHAVGDDIAELAARPSAGDVLGSNPSPQLTDPLLKRGFTFRSALGNTQRIRLFSVPINAGGTARVATATFGGFDARDVALVAYLSGVETGLVIWDGVPYPPTARVYHRVQRPLQPPPGAPLAGDYLVSG